MTEALLRELKTQIEDGRDAAALDTIDELLDAFDSDRAETRRHDVVATAVRYNSASDSRAATAADEYVEVATELDQARTKLNEAIIGYLTQESSLETLVDPIDETLEAYDELEAKSETLLERTDDVPLGIILHLNDVDQVRVPKGSAVGVGTTLENLGSDAETDISVDATSDAQVSTSVSPEQIDSLAPDEEAAIGLSLEGDSTGDGRIRLTTEGATVRESIQFSVEVLDKVGYLKKARDIATILVEDLDEQEHGRGRGNSSNGLRNRLEEIHDRLGTIIERIDSGRGNENEINNRIESVVNRFEAVKNTLTNGNDERLDEVVSAEYVARSEDAVDLLETSLDAST